MRIGILNSGGDCPGLNAVIHGVVGAAAQLGCEVVGFRDGFEGMLPPGDYVILRPQDTIGILKLGGTILGSTNKGHFGAKIGKGEVSEVPSDIIAKAKKTMDSLGIGALIIVGGDGSLTTGLQLFRNGWPIIGVPKTIDNDLSATAFTFGFDSAVSTVVDALDRLHTTGESHKRVMVLEVMGRHAIRSDGGETCGRRKFRKDGQLSSLSRRFRADRRRRSSTPFGVTGKRIGRGGQGCGNLFW